MPRFLLLLSILQLAAIALLFAEIGELDDRLAIPASATTTVSNVTDTGQADAMPETITLVAAPTAGLSAEEVRAIVREELARAGQAAERQQPADYSLPEVESQARLEAFYLEVEAYVGRGMISDQEMSDLQSQMAGLNPPEQKLALRRLTQAINSGGVDARL